MEEKIIFMGLVIIVLLTIVVLYLIVNDENDTKARTVSKFMALATPCLLALIIVLGIFVTGITKTIKKVEYIDTNETVGMQEQYEMYKRDLDRNYEVLMDTVDKKMNIGLSILGIAVTVWVGLNIYNVLKREDLEELKRATDKIAKKVDEFVITLENQDKEVIRTRDEINSFEDKIRKMNIMNKSNFIITQMQDKDRSLQFFISQEDELYNRRKTLDAIFPLLNELNELVNKEDYNEVKEVMIEILNRIKIYISKLNQYEINMDEEKSNFIINYLKIGSEIAKWEQLDAVRKVQVKAYHLPQKEVKEFMAYIDYELEECYKKDHPLISKEDCERLRKYTKEFREL